MQGRCLLGSIGNDDAVPSQNCCSTVWAALLTPLSHTRLHDVGGVLGLFPDLNSPTQRRFSCSASCTTQGAKRGLTRRELGGSCYGRAMALEGGVVPQPADWGPRTMRALHGAIHAGMVTACHDCSEGGLVVALAEMCIAGHLGIKGSLAAQPREGKELHDAWLLFAETSARFVVEVAPQHRADFEGMLRDVPCGLLGRVTRAEELVVEGHQGAAVLRVTVEALRQAWRGHVEDAVRGVAQ